MKQIVGRVQAERLWDAGIEIIKAPTIGELIEWIKENAPKGCYLSIDFGLNCHICCVNEVRSILFGHKNTELIDALVELAIKIKESKQ